MKNLVYLTVGILASTLFLTPSASAADYYIDYASGADDNDGISKNSPWKHCPGDSKATANATVSFQPGDKVFFKGGVSYILTSTNAYSVYGVPGLYVINSGTVDKPITYDGNSAGDWGTGKAQITDNHGTLRRSAFFFLYGQGSNVVIKNFDIGKMGGISTLPSDSGSPLPPNYAAGIVAEVGFQNVTISDCYLHEMGYWQNTKPIANSSLGGHGIRACGAGSGQTIETRNLIITNCELTKIRQPIQIQCFKDVQQVEIVGCYIHDYMEWAMDIAYNSTKAYFENISIHDNRFVDYDKWYSTQFWTGYGEAPHQNGIYWRCDIVGLTTPSTTNINFYNNLFKATGSWSGGTTAIYLDGDNQANIYNNLFDNVQAANAAIQLQLFSAPQKTTRISALILNNTFYMTKTAISAGSAPPYYTDWPLSNKMFVTNNIFVNPLKNAGYQFIQLFNMDNFASAATNSLRFDYNSYEIYNNSYPQLMGIYQPGYNYITFGSTKGFGWNAHSTFTPPLFVDAFRGDYRLLPNSPQVGKGVNFSNLNLPGLNRDKDGNLRPATGPWTMGAYEPTLSLRPSPPQNAHLTN